VRTIVAALRNTGYYDIRPLASEEAAERALAEGEVLFVINIPPNFERSVDRGETPAILVDADATDPSARDPGSLILLYNGGHNPYLLSDHFPFERHGAVVHPSPNPLQWGGARTRSGKPCQSPAVRGKRRCRMQGGAAGSGAPLGNTNALRHGHYTAEAIARRRQLSELIRMARATLAEIDERK
jgi:hypothetical protein